MPQCRLKITQKKEVIAVLRFYQSLVAHRSMLKAILMVAAVIAMSLGLVSGAAADWDGFDP